MEKTGRKRPLDEVTGLEESAVETTKRTSSDLSTTTTAVTMNHSNIKRLSLEAIFHPKFENENREQQDIRRQMKERVANQEGHLEVSLKHSGSLLLWSGGQRYYSKNSSCNPFTYVGELLLRQHFYRAWSGEGGASTDGEANYQKCSDYVEQHRLTLAFEVVTTVLGHHGDLPKRDFLVLTAVADRSGERFFSTQQILQFAQQHRLPHNDVWVYSTVKAVNQLFKVYDTKRETGLADDMVASLCQSADSHVSSMYPHVDFQGNILEGIVIRYVANVVDSTTKSLQELADASNDILKKVPPATPASFESVKEGSPVLTTNVREIKAKLVEGGNYKDVFNRLGDQVDKVFRESEASRRATVKQKGKEWDIPGLAKDLLSREDIDDETKRIARVIEKASGLRSRIEYAVFRENEDRWLCIIHVLHDQTFKRYQKSMNDNDMHLFRGFCVELGTSQAQEGNHDEVSMKDVVDAMHYNDSASLMLKMKLLPYMVRTFACRNGLRTIEKMGPREFAAFTMKLMKRWGISQRSQEKWQPFFVAWGNYAKAWFDNVEAEFIDRSLPPLNGDSYLNHLNHFVPLYEAGKIPFAEDMASDGSTYRAFVAVTSLHRNISDDVADYISKHFGGVPRISSSKQLTEEAMLQMKVPRGGGLVWSTTVEEGFKPLARFLRKYADSISVVMVGCDVDQIEMEIPEDKQSRIKGMAKGFASLRCKTVIKLPLSAVSEQASSDTVSNEVEQALETLKSVSDATSCLDVRPGCLIFYPGIPGCGKSSISNEETSKLLEGKMKELASENKSESKAARAVATLMGDKIAKKYWQRVRIERLEQSSSVYVADKNAPPSSWTTVGESTGTGVAIPVIPDMKALSTTSVKGARYPNGNFHQDKSHFYPFSLHYLAVCMWRVLSRPPRSHTGKLDSALPTACLIVAKFYGFYRFQSAEEFQDTLFQRLSDGGALTPNRCIEMPFFKDGNLPNLPKELEDILVEAVQFQVRLRFLFACVTDHTSLQVPQYGCDLKNKDTGGKKHDREVLEVENRLRETLDSHKDFIESLTIDKEASREAFIEQVTAQVRILDEQGISDTVVPTQSQSQSQPTKGQKIQLVAVDVKQKDVHNMLSQLSKVDKSVAEFLQAIGVSKPKQTPFKLWEFVKNTHITMAHKSTMSEADMKVTFGELIGKEVDITVHGVLWSDRVAALAIDIPCEVDGIPIPPCKNKFVHITLWTIKGANAVESSNLPKQLSNKKAKKISFENPRSLKGTFSFWSPGKGSR